MAELNVHTFTVYDMIARGAAVHGDAPAVIQGERALSFRALRGRVDELATVSLNLWAAENKYQKLVPNLFGV